jgi:predicted dehydrogenase
MDTIRWGIMGASRIAAAFVDAVGEAQGGEVTAIGSSSPERAEDFGSRHGIPHRHGTYEDVAADPAVDAVYVATTNDSHLATTLMSIAHDKPVLCEKPFALNGTQARQMVSAARRANLFLMEAMWMRFQPATDRLQEIVRSGTIGEICTIHADFGFPAGPHASGRLFDPGMGGGTILDLGVYVVTLATMLLGPPDRVSAQIERFDSGVDRQAGIVLHHGEGGMSTLGISFVSDTSTEAVISGPKGRVRMHAPFHHSPMLTLERRESVAQTIDTSYEGSGYRFEVEEVHRCLRAGLAESPKMPLDDTLAVMDVLDGIRAQVGLVFPGE